MICWTLVLFFLSTRIKSADFLSAPPKKTNPCNFFVVFILVPFFFFFFIFFTLNILPAPKTTKRALRAAYRCKEHPGSKGHWAFRAFSQQLPWLTGAGTDQPRSGVVSTVRWLFRRGVFFSHKS
ncbi:hypothetical protein HYPBUDRAFT_203119 [Hyphopichia burtonii NRRL Y-1933]|uniref:Secreted protein n=1 Tax=Hyphopichia burtonii NRRL Y-1933 TaxID=984485 RepID=A0A1E4RLS7_9ASCO|nr:hypothetical protein HYPBUDRAFT_203119 [Hyphopichia burtonii NRRL Y-1933]ODV68196.1 hypothetical protein HYPBUDRAFT_203119 [Hyphopichia burtonii NRRL Y-1933]